MKRKRDRPVVQESLIPLLEAEEARLSADLQKVRDEGEERLKKAKTDAEGVLAAALEEMRKALETERVSRLAGLRGEGEQKRVGQIQELSGYEAVCRSRLDEAVALILSIVYGGSDDQ
jgi:hypothetical protein